MAKYIVRVRYVMEHFEEVDAPDANAAEVYGEEIFSNSADCENDEFVEVESVEAEEDDTDTTDQTEREAPADAKAEEDSPEEKEYAVDVTYRMVHAFHVKAKDAREAIDKATDAFIFGGEDLSDDEMDGFDHATIVDVSE